MLGEPGDEARARLRAVMAHVRDTYHTYRASFDEIGVVEAEIGDRDPLSLLTSLPLLESERFEALVRETLSLRREVIDMEASSGTTGLRKRRLIPPADELAETGLLARIFGIAGVGPGDRVACVDTGPLTLMVSFTRALERLDVEEAYAFCVSPDIGETLDRLSILDPTVVVTVPSILEGFLPHMAGKPRRTHLPGLRSVIYVGEPLPGETRRRLDNDLGIEVFAYYGTSETSALGVECPAHNGVHLFVDEYILELETGSHGAGAGEIIVTTLRQEGLPLLRYALRDLVAVKEGPCSCGLPFPRVDVVGRADGTVSVLGVKLTYAAIRSAAYERLGPPGPLEVVLTRNGREHLTIVLPDRLTQDAAMVRNAVLARETELAYLVGGRFLRLDLAFVNESHFDARKTAQGIVDRRGGAAVD